MSVVARVSKSAVVAVVLLWGGVSQAQRICTGVTPVSHTGLKRVLVGEGFSRPILVLAPSGDASRIFIVEQPGTIRVLPKGAGPTEHTLFMDVSDRVSTLGSEMGLLGMAFDPGFAVNGRFYLSYTTFVGGMIRSTVRRFNLDPSNPAVGDPDSEHDVITFLQPGENNHNGGHIEFGPDGYLYLSVGDGGGGGDNHGTCGNGQETANLLGTILRIDPGTGSPTGPECAESGDYSVPTDNPLADGPGGACDEIWAYGLRNPWRFAFDRAADDLYIADVGQHCWEEINYVPATSAGGENYGWRSMEGQHCFNPATPFNCDPVPASCADALPCDDPGFVAPVAEYNHAQGCSVSGGFVYRGCRMPDLSGTYFYGDYCSAFVRSFRVVGGAVTDPQNWTALGLTFGVSGFGLDAQGELYVLEHIAGSATRVFKVVPLLSDIEVSGKGAADDFLLDKGGEWTWEDVFSTTSQPVDEYRVYRSDTGVFEFACIHTSTTPSWPDGGDTAEPQAEQLLSYLVTAVEGVEESSAGLPSRVLASGCPN